MLPVNVVRRGTTTAPTPPVHLRAGPLTARFEPDGIFLRHIRLGEHEILRGIYVAVRDHNWDTIFPIVTSLDIQTTEDTFAINVDVRCREREVDFTWHSTITGQADGTIRFTMDGTAQSSFWRNRIGILVLHPPKDVAGKPAIVEAPDGTTTEGQFPVNISPHQPFFNIRALTHEVTAGVSAEVRFEGDVFEMEDQRNWTDASYKTYSTPLGLPFPVRVEEGTQISQAIELRVHGNAPVEHIPDLASTIRMTPGESLSVQIPRIGLGLSTGSSTLTEQEISRLRQLNLGQMRVDLRLSEPHHAERLQRSIEQSRAIDVPLQVALFLADGCESALESAIDQLAEHEVEITEWLILSEAEKVASRTWVEIAMPVIRSRYSHAVIASGTNAYFTELNRERPETDLLDAVCYSINPQVHAFDDLSLVETLEAQSWTVDSTLQFANGRDVIVSPITLRPRFNPNATGPEPEPEPGQLPDSVDPRQMSLFGAGWTLGSLKYIARSGVLSGTWFETIGWKGVMETEAGPPVPDQFRSVPGAVFPLWHVFADFAEFRDGEIISTTSTDPLRVDGCLLRSGTNLALIVANLTGDEQKVEIDLPESASVGHVRIMDETNAEIAMTDPDGFRKGPGHPLDPSPGRIPLTLKPFAYARLSGRTSS